MDEYLFSTAISVLSAAIASALSDEELDLTAAVFTQLGDSLATIAVLRGQSKNKSATPIVELETIV